MILPLVRCILIISLSSLILNCLCSPLDYQPRAAINCVDVNADFDPSCWATLGLSDWLVNQWKPKVCTANDDGSDCCDPGEEWSTCFLKMGIGQGYNCTTISSDICAYSPKLRRNLNEVDKPKFRYVLKNIFCKFLYYFILRLREIYDVSDMHAFFLDWYHAVDGASGTPASSIIDGIIQEVDPEKKTHSFLGAILTALTAGLAFIPAVGPEVSAGVSAATTALVTGLQQAPGIAKAIWPEGTQNVSNIPVRFSVKNTSHNHPTVPTSPNFQPRD